MNSLNAPEFHNLKGGKVYILLQETENRKIKQTIKDVEETKEIMERLKENPGEQKSSSGWGAGWW